MDPRILSIAAVLVLISVSSSANQHDLIRLKLVRQTRPLSRQEFISSQQFASTVNDNNNNKGDDKQANHLNKMNILRMKGYSYIGEIHVGEPARKFRVFLDSGSGDLWLPISKCNNVDKTITSVYKPKQSTSFSRDGRRVSVRYGNGVEVSGELGRESIRLAGLTLENQTFIQAERLNDGRILRYFRVDGIMGLNFVSTSGHLDIEAPIHKILRVASQQSANGAPIKSMLSLSLNLGPDDNNAGQLIIGGLDESLYVGPIAWSPLMRSHHWQFRLDSIELNSMAKDDSAPMSNDLTVCPHGCSAMVDTGTTLIGGNRRDIGALNERIGARDIGDSRFVLPTCKDLDSKLPHLSLNIAGRRFSLTPTQYTFESQGVCFTAFTEMDAGGQWVLGEMFIGHFYIILDYHDKRFGLADSAHKRNVNTFNHS